MSKRISLKDIAREAGVSTALVSYVMNGKEKQARVGPEMARKIRRIAKKLNYRPNLIAQSLKSGKSSTIGLIVADISNSFFSNIARIVEDEAKKYGYTVIMGSSDESAQKSQDLIEVFLRRQVDGLIIAPAEGTEAQLKLLGKKNIPYVLIDRYFPALKSNSVTIDNFNAAYTAITHLVESGYRRIATLTYANSLYHTQERKRGYLQALADKGIRKNDKWVLEARYNELATDVPRLLKRVLNPSPEIDAVFFATNTLAVEGLRVINDLKIKIPGNIGIVSFDENDAFDFFYSPLTYVKQSLTDMGQESVRALIKSMEKQPAGPERRIVKHELIIRTSSNGLKVKKKNS